jgi:hypothetical protein
VIGFRFRFYVPPDDPGAPKIFIFRIIFLVPGLLLLGFGLWEVWRYFHLPAPADAQSHGSRFTLNLMEMNLEPRAVARDCAFVFLAAGAFFLWLALCAEHCLRKGEVPDENVPMFVSARQFTVFASLIGYLYFFGLVLMPWLCKIFPGIVVGLIWLITAWALFKGILRFFQKSRAVDRK